MSTTEDFKENQTRRHSALGPRPRHLTETFKGRRNGIMGTFKSPLKEHTEKQTFEELQEESNKLRNFLRKICTQDEEAIDKATSNKSHTNAFKRLASIKSPKPSSSKSINKKSL